jgi:hypothetical protein
METENIADALEQLAQILDKCSDDAPYEISAHNDLYFRMVDAAKEARTLAGEIKG